MQPYRDLDLDADGNDQIQEARIVGVEMVNSPGHKSSRRAIQSQSENSPNR